MKYVFELNEIECRDVLYGLAERTCAFNERDLPGPTERVQRLLDKLLLETKRQERVHDRKSVREQDAATSG